MASHIRHRCGGISVLATIWICPKSRYWQQDGNKPVPTVIVCNTLIIKVLHKSLKTAYDYFP